jgi:DNA repair exonuclease SbcCD ATPase subunit
MRNLKFHSAQAENILCFGPEGVKFHFTDYGQVIQVRGINLDNPGTTDNPASNGAGKSSIQEILSIGLFGKTVKSPTKLKGREILNTVATKGQIEIEWDDYRVVRGFKKASAGSISSKIQTWHSKDRIWDDSSETTKGTTAETQKWIDEKIGMNHHTFCNVVIFDDSSFYSFLESDGPTKREFVENLLGLDQYRTYHNNAKELLKDRKKTIQVLGSEYEMLQNNIDACTHRIQTLQQQQAQWKRNKQAALSDFLTRIKSKQTELETTNAGEQLTKWQKGQDRIVELTAEIDKYDGLIKKVKDWLLTVYEQQESAKQHKDSLSAMLQKHKLAVSASQAEVDKNLKLIDKLNKLEDGASCPLCFGTISKGNYGKVLNHGHTVIQEHQASIRTDNASVEYYSSEYNKSEACVKAEQKKITDGNAKIVSYEAKIRDARKEIMALSAISKPDSNSKEQVLEAEISELKKQVKAVKDELDGACPYDEILIQAEKEKDEAKIKSDNKANEIYLAEEQLPYYQFWVEAFGDKGIRRYIVDGIIPALNARIAYWLSYLIDSKIELTFNNELEETITRSGNVAYYYAMSNGERRRINLAVSQAFAYVMMLNSGCCPSIVFLDEITGGGIDRAGVVGIYNMIYELAKERQVFVTTHNENLMSMLQGCETLTLKKQNDVTVLSS